MTNTSQLRTGLLLFGACVVSAGLANCVSAGVPGTSLLETEVLRALKGTEEPSRKAIVAQILSRYSDDAVADFVSSTRSDEAKTCVLAAIVTETGRAGLVRRLLSEHKGGRAKLLWIIGDNPIHAPLFAPTILAAHSSFGPLARWATVTLVPVLDLDKSQRRSLLWKSSFDDYEKTRIEARWVIAKRYFAEFSEIVRESRKKADPKLRLFALEVLVLAPVSNEERGKVLAEGLLDKNVEVSDCAYYESISLLPQMTVFLAPALTDGDAESTAVVLRLLRECEKPNALGLLRTMQLPLTVPEREHTVEYLARTLYREPRPDWRIFIDGHFVIALRAHHQSCCLVLLVLVSLVAVTSRARANSESGGRFVSFCSVAVVGAWEIWVYGSGSAALIKTSPFFSGAAALLMLIGSCCLFAFPFSRVSVNGMLGERADSQAKD